MTFDKLKELIEKYNIPGNVTLLSDSGWEVEETDMDGVFYNEAENHIIFTQEFSEFEKYTNRKNYKALR